MHGQVSPSLLPVLKGLGAMETLEGLGLMEPGDVSHQPAPVVKGLSTLVAQHHFFLVVLGQVDLQAEKIKVGRENKKTTLTRCVV